MTEQTMPRVGQPQDLAPDLACILAPNASPMTYWGTNSYILGRAELMVIDPGPDDPAHLDALLDTIKGRPVSHILVTHSHVDHSPLAARLAALVHAPVLAYGNARAGRSDRMQALALSDDLGGREGVDHGFTPDICLKDGAQITNSELTLTALHTPGHFGNHLSYAWKNAVFTGDQVMGWASTLISPPDGDVSDFMASCDRLERLNAEIFYAGHGPVITAPQERLDWLRDNRRAREAQILSALSHHAGSATDLAQRIYTDIDPRLLPAATRNVLAHLIDLHHKRQVSQSGPLTADTIFERT